MSDELIILFDEHGTPTFRTDRESHFFIGVGITYKISDQDNIFTTDRKLFGLDNNKPVKNGGLSLSRIDSIGSLITNMPIDWTIILLDLSNSDLQRVVTLYEEYSNLLRSQHRGVRERSVAQILYQQVLDHALFSSIQNSIERNPINTNVSIYLDNWAFSPEDLWIVLDLNRESMEQKSNEVIEQFFNVKISLNNFEIFVNDSDKKRYIDVITSVTSRAFMSTSDDRYSKNIKSILDSKDNHQIYIDDITQNTVNFLTKVMDQTARGK